MIGLTNGTHSAEFPPITFLGYGYWGQNVLRTLMRDLEVPVKWACDPNPGRVAQLRDDYPNLATTVDAEVAIGDPEVAAVVCVTPAETHVRLVKQALRQGKHVFVEKPLATTVDDARELALFARDIDRVVQVGHIFKHAAPVRALHKLVREGELGDIHYITANRASLGPRLRTDVNVVWDYAVHDVYLLMFLMGREPDAVSATGARRFYPTIEDTVFAQLRFGTTLAHLHASWAAPLKRRELTVVGTQGMAVYDDTANAPLIRYRRGYVPINGRDRWGNQGWQLFDDGAEVVELEAGKSLETELRHFFDCIAHHSAPLSGIDDGVSTVKVLAAIDDALRSGQEVAIGPGSLR